MKMAMLNNYKYLLAIYTYKSIKIALLKLWMQCLDTNITNLNNYFQNIVPSNNFILM